MSESNLHIITAACLFFGIKILLIALLMTISKQFNCRWQLTQGQA